MDSRWEDSVSHREPSQAPCDNLEGWDGGMRGLKEGEKIYIYMCVCVCKIKADSHCCMAETNTTL